MIYSHSMYGSDGYTEAADMMLASALVTRDYMYLSLVDYVADVSMHLPEVQGFDDVI
jgi:hypothetical protein